MKTNNQSRNFSKQVQIDLLALSDTDLSIVIRQWMGGENSSSTSQEITVETYTALGYIPITEDDIVIQWQAPSIDQLRALLTAMDVSLFTQQVIPLAFQFLHPTYPEWYEGVTFNAHLANYLRQTRVGVPVKRADIKTVSQSRS